MAITGELAGGRKDIPRGISTIFTTPFEDSGWNALPEIHRVYTDPSTLVLVFRSRVMHGNTCSPYGRRSSRVFLLPPFFPRDPDLENVSPISRERIESHAETNRGGEDV